MLPLVGCPKILSIVSRWWWLRGELLMELLPGEAGRLLGPPGASSATVTHSAHVRTPDGASLRTDVRQRQGDDRPATRAAPRGATSRGARHLRAAGAPCAASHA